MSPDVPRFAFALALIALAAACTPSARDDASPSPEEAPPAPSTPIPVIYDTDLGTDIDDTWALALLLASPELDLRLVVTDTGDTRARARIVAKFLDAAGRGDIPIGIGVPDERDGDLAMGQLPWADDYDLADYPGTVHEDGVQAMIDAVQSTSEPTTLLAVGPVTNLAAALDRAPDLAQKVRVVAMSGSVDLGYASAPEPSPEYNVAFRIPEARRMYSADWDLLIAPLDTAGQVKLEGDEYQRLVASESRTVRALLDGYRVWAPTFEWNDLDVDVESSYLFDALAVALLHQEDLCEIEEVPLVVDDEGFTRRDDAGRGVRAALRWQPGARERFQSDLVDRLLRLP